MIATATRDTPTALSFSSSETPESMHFRENPPEKSAAEIKEDFQKKYGIERDKKRFLVGIVTPLFEEHNAEVLVDMLPGLSELGAQIAFRANASEHYRDILIAFQKDHKDRCVIVADHEYDEILRAADTVIFFSEKPEIMAEDLKNALQNGVVPIAPAPFVPRFVEDYNPNLETGNSFLYPFLSPWSLFGALVRTHENFRFPYDWKNIKKSAEKTAFSEAL
ncbi:MAG: hypothetical protein WCJ84_00600 [Candidatus Peregrinibacteria bacterium]